MVTITRKIELRIVDKHKESYAFLYNWNEQVFRAANTAVTHMYFQDKMKEFFYLTDEAKILFADINKPEAKQTEKEKEQRASADLIALNTSRQNSSYQVLSERFRGKMPSDIYSNLNAQIYGVFQKEKQDYFSGKKSLRSYRRNLPMPFTTKNMRQIALTEDKKNYTFTLFDINFSTFFGRDLSGNKTIFEKALQGEYKLCNSSIQLDGKKIYLLAVFQFEQLKFDLKKDKVMEAELSCDFPIILKCGTASFRIGDREEYLHRRYAIQAGLVL